MSEVVLILYFGVLGSLSLLGIHRLLLAIVALRSRSSPARELVEAPPLLVQLPIFNEALVAERLLLAASRLRYPGKLTLQVLDDSTDDTSRVIDRCASELRGIDVRIERRGERSGYKAGALAYGLARSDQELIAIFDADFIPPPDFLERTVPALLASDRTAMVQARWGHKNR